MTKCNQEIRLDKKSGWIKSEDVFNLKQKWESQINSYYWEPNVGRFCECDGYWLKSAEEVEWKAEWVSVKVDGAQEG